jgi:hypothetical protein
MITFKVNDVNANFWLVRKGAKQTVGKPVRDFSKEHIGVTITGKLLLPEYMYYYFDHLHQRKTFENLAKGTTQLCHIRVSDMNEMFQNGI